MNNSGMEKSVNEAANAAVNNSTANVINQDNSQTTNKTEYSTSSIGASNPNDLAKEMSNIG